MTDQCGLEPALVMECDPNGAGPIHHMVVGEHQAFRVHDDPASGRDSYGTIIRAWGRQRVVSGHLLNPGSNQWATLYVYVNGGRQDRFAQFREVGSNRLGPGGWHPDYRREAEQEKFQAIVHVVKLN